MRITQYMPMAWGLGLLMIAGCENVEMSSRQSETVERAAESRPASQLGGGRSIADRLSCSTLCQRKQTTEVAFKAVADMGFRYVDLSCLTWAPHANAIELRKDFEAEAVRVERLLAANRLGVSNLTYDAMEVKPFEEYEQDFRVLVRLAARLRARVINIMAPSKKVDLEDQIGKLRKLQAIAAEGGVQLTVETHLGQVTEWPADAMKLCERVPGLGLTLDPSHYYAGPNQGQPFEVLYPKVYGTGFRAVFRGRRFSCPGARGRSISRRSSAGWRRRGTRVITWPSTSKGSARPTRWSNAASFWNGARGCRGSKGEDAPRRHGGTERI